MRFFPTMYKKSVHDIDYRALKEKGVLVRHFDGRIADYIRITVGSRSEVETLLDCLKEIL